MSCFIGEGVQWWHIHEWKTNNLNLNSASLLASALTIPHALFVSSPDSSATWSHLPCRGLLSKPRDHLKNALTILPVPPFCHEAAADLHSNSASICILSLSIYQYIFTSLLYVDEARLPLSPLHHPPLQPSSPWSLLHLILLLPLPFLFADLKPFESPGEKKESILIRSTMHVN